MTILTDHLQLAIDEIPRFVPRCIAREVLIKTLKAARTALKDGPVCVADYGASTRTRSGSIASAAGWSSR